MTSTRDRLITATNELFRRHGYNGTSLKQVTEAAEAPTGSLYHFFPGGKADLTDAVIRETGAAYLQLFVTITADFDEPGEAIEAFFAAAADTLAETDFIDICPIGTVAREVASVDEGLRVAADEVFNSWIEGLAAWLTASGLDAERATEFAHLVVSTLEGGFILARASRNGAGLASSGRHLRTLIDATIGAGSQTSTL